MKRIALIAMFLAGVCPWPSRAEGENIKSVQVLSKVYSITKKYKSMEGPASTQPVQLLENEPPQLVWVRGFRSEIVGGDGAAPASQEFMCHINLDVNYGAPPNGQPWATERSARLFTLSQAQFAVDFPEGFGLPLLSNQSLSLATQVLNHNYENPNVEVRHKVTIDFVKDSDLKKPLKPLFATNAFGMKLLEGKDGHFGAVPGMSGPSCLPGEHAQAAGQTALFPDGQGRKFSGHWVVKPGKEVNHTDVTQLLGIPFDTTVHFINIHLHPFAESLELRDLTANKRIFKTHARGPKHGIGLAYIESFSSAEGLPMYKDHRYELVSIYNNTSGVNQDAMATMFLYLLDKNYKKPDPKVVAAIHPVPVKIPPMPLVPLEPAKLAEISTKRIILHTRLGDMVVALDPQSAPQTSWQFLTLVRAGLYDTIPFVYVQPGFVTQVSSVLDRTVPLTGSQRSSVHRLPLESGALKHQRGVLSIARDPKNPNSGESSFCIMLGDAPHLDGSYTAFGRVERGMEVLAALEKEPLDDQKRPKEALRIDKAEVVDAAKAKRMKLKGPVARPAVSAAPSPQAAGDHLRVHTSLGDMTFKLYPAVAPKTVEQILKLASAGDYDSTAIFRVEPGFVAQISPARDRQIPLSPEQQSLLHKLPAEFSGLKHRRGILSMARETADVNSAESSFSILLGDAPHLDGKYTIFGEMESGNDVLSAIEKAPRQGNAPLSRIAILKMDIVRS